MGHESSRKTGNESGNDCERVMGKGAAHSTLRAHPDWGRVAVVGYLDESLSLTPGLEA